MKKIILTTLLLLSFGLCFAETKVIEEGKNPDNFVINIGEINYGTKHLSTISVPNDRELRNDSFNLEIGFFNSDEDGLLDLVSFSLFGFSCGRISSDDFRYYWDGENLFPTDNAWNFNIYGKDTLGLQVNLLAFSLGTTIGPKYGYDRTSQKLENIAGEDFKFTENRLFLDFVVDPYVSVNIMHTVKIFLKSDFDFPVFRLRFLNYEREYKSSDSDIRCDWFKNDIPITYMIGASFLF